MYIDSENVKWCSKQEFLYDPAILNLDVHPKELKIGTQLHAYA